MPDRHANPDILLRWPSRLRDRPPAADLAPGYVIRTYETGDDEAWVRVYARAVPSFAEADLRSWWSRYLTLALPRSIYFAAQPDGDIVATAGCIHHTRDGQYPFAGQLAWVATDPDHQCRGLATALCATATRRLIEIGYETILVCTGDDLLPAIKVYLRLGFEPFLYEPGMKERWTDILSRIDVASA